jgi:hypothetical protein
VDTVTALFVTCVHLCVPAWLRANGEFGIINLPYATRHQTLVYKTGQFEAKKLNPISLSKNTGD